MLESLYDLVRLEQLCEMCLHELLMWLVDKKPEDWCSTFQLADEFVDSRTYSEKNQRVTGPSWGPKRGGSHKGTPKVGFK